MFFSGDEISRSTLLSRSKLLSNNQYSMINYSHHAVILIIHSFCKWKLQNDLLYLSSGIHKFVFYIYELIFLKERLHIQMRSCNIYLFLSWRDSFFNHFKSTNESHQDLYSVTVFLISSISF